MEDIVPKLLDLIQKDFQKKFENNKKIKVLYENIKNGKSTYKEANEFAIHTGRILSNTFQMNFSTATLPDGKLYYNIADRTIRPMMKKNYDLVSDMCERVQEILNRESGIGIKGIPPKLNEDKIQGIIDIVSGKEKYDDVAYMLGEPIVNFTQSIVDDAVRANADFQYRAGLSPKIRRTSTGKCCNWCDKIAGVYNYEDVSNTGNNVFRRHKYCRCTIEYEPGDGKRQNVHTKKWEKTEDSDIIKKKVIGLPLDADAVIEKIKKEIAEQNIEKITDRQDIHRIGTKLYEERKKQVRQKGEYGPSYVTVTDDVVLELVKRYSGTGIVKYNRRGEWNHQEIIVTNDKIIGVVIDNRNGRSTETSVFKIHYSNDGVHIVPDYPSKRR